MRHPIINELPPLPSGKTGWPWVEEGLASNNVSSTMTSYPKISIVTPSYNQGKFLEEAIRSVLLQAYPNLEYIVIDGNSSDNSKEIIQKYEGWLSYWVSEADRGQSHALNKGFSQANGQIFGWLNSDDYLHPGALTTLADLRRQKPGSIVWVGACQEVDINGRRLRKRFPKIGNMEQFANWSRDAWIPQPSCLFDAEAFKNVGMLDEKLNFVMDVDLWMKLAEIGPFVGIDKIVSYARMYASIKTRRNIPMQQAEHILICFKQGLPKVAQKRMENCMTFRLDAWPYRKLLKYFMGRTVRWAWQCFKWLCGA